MIQWFDKHVKKAKPRGETDIADREQ